MANITKEELKQIFDYGHYFSMQSKFPEKFISGTFPTDYNEALEYVYKLVIEKERDEECLSCGRYSSGSCKGTINRHREEITEKNRCAAYFKKKEN